MHNREFASVCWFTIPGGCNHIPNAVLQPLILTWTRWAGWWNAPSDIVDHVDLLGAVDLLDAIDFLNAVDLLNHSDLPEDHPTVEDHRTATSVDLLTGSVRRYSREDLIVTERLRQAVRWFIAEEHTSKDVNARE